MGAALRRRFATFLKLQFVPKVGIGSTLAAFASEIGHVDFDSDMNFQRDRTPVRPVSFE